MSLFWVFWRKIHFLLDSHSFLTHSLFIRTNQSATLHAMMIQRSGVRIPAATFNRRWYEKKSFLAPKSEWNRKKKLKIGRCFGWWRVFWSKTVWPTGIRPTGIWTTNLADRLTDIWLADILADIHFGWHSFWLTDIRLPGICPTGICPTGIWSTDIGQQTFDKEIFVQETFGRITFGRITFGQQTFRQQTFAWQTSGWQSFGQQTFSQ